MSGYILDVDMEFYGPYYTEEQARFAKFLFDSKHPDMADQCEIRLIELDAIHAELIRPELLH